jgi:hypothetical protein
MKDYQIRNTALLLVVSAVVLVSASCQNKTADNGSGASPATYHEYSVDISNDNAPQQKIHKTNDERIVWVNNSNGPLYICIDPANDPFEAYGWYVPGNGGTRKTGKIVDGLNPAAGASIPFTFNPSPTACTGASFDQGVRSTPKIIIVQH